MTIQTVFGSAVPFIKAKTEALREEAKQGKGITIKFKQKKNKKRKGKK